MLKKIALASAILAASTGVALANPAPYVGVSSGVVVNTLNISSHHHSVEAGGYRGVPFNLFAGYGGMVNCNFYLAGELFGTVATANISDNDAQLKSTYGFGAAILPGVMLSDHTLGYIRAGVVRTHFKLDDDAKQTKTGGQFGVGLQTNLCQNLDLRGEYDFVSYGSLSHDGEHHHGHHHHGVSASPRSDQFTVGLVYKFD